MSGYGSAPRLVNGTWRTRSGRALSPKGQTYWSNKHARGETDGQGHIRQVAQAQVAQAEPMTAPPKKPSFDTVVAAKKGNKQARQQVRLYSQHQRLTSQAKADVETATDKRLFGASLPAVQSAYKTIDPRAAAVIKASSPTEAIKAGVKDLRHGNIGGAALEAASILPMGRGARAVKAGIDVAEQAAPAIRATKSAVRTLSVEKKVQQLPRARSRITQNVIEKPADAASRAMMGEGKIAKGTRRVLPTASVEARVSKAAGRQNLEYAGAAAAPINTIARRLPREGSVKDVAHYYWAQLPGHLRNTEGLRQVRQRIASELEKVTPERLAKDPGLAEAIGARVALLDHVIKKNPKYDQQTIDALHTISGDRKNVLQAADLLHPERATAREGIVARWLGHEPAGHEVFIGHRTGNVPGSQVSLLPASPGTGKPRLPKGVSRKNDLVLISQGRDRPSTHVALQDWRAAHTYRSALRARDDLGLMGRPFTGTIDPRTENLINPKGRVVPATWKTDQIAELVRNGASEDELRSAVKQVLDRGFLARSETDAPLTHAELEGIVKEWGATHADLRVVPKATVDRYYAQFVPHRVTTKGGKLYDRVVDGVMTSLIFARPGYIPKNFVQNAIMAVPHQGPLMAFNIPRGLQMLKDPELRPHVLHAIGQGATGALAKEGAAKITRKLTSGVSNVADAPLRASALVNELAAERVISRFSPVVTAEEKQKLLQFFTGEEHVAARHDITHRTRDAMGDFGRMTPTQRKWARRFLIIPGWLVAGSRYPVHFAATHPLRSAAMGYVAAGEPGAPDQFQVNKPVDEYFAKGLPSYLQGVESKLGLWRTGSVSPVSTPIEAASALTARSPGTAADYINPIPMSAINVLGRKYETASGETKNTTYTDAIKRNFLGRLVPNYGFAKDEISPPSPEGRIYSDTSRVGRLKRELGVFPVKIDRSAAERSAFRERGMDKSVAILSDRSKLLDKAKAAGEKPSQALYDAYDLKLERAKRLDGIREHGLAYQQKAYKSDIELLVSRGIIKKDEGAATLKAATGASEDELKKWRTWLGVHKFGGETIRGVKQYLREQEKATAGTSP